ncbi:MAG: PEP-CTERM sorting domain-containing protein [Chthoniobacteraceae bacterium]
MMNNPTPCPSRLVGISSYTPSRGQCWKALAAIVVTAIISAATANAAATTYYWDTNGSSAGTGGNGTWNTAYSYWRANSDTGAATTWPNTPPSTSVAYFGGTSGTVGILSGSTIYTNGIIFGTDGYVITGSSATSSILYLDGTSPSIQMGANSATFNNVTLKITDNTTATVVGTGTLTMTGSSALVVGSPNAGASTTLDLSGLSNFVYNSPNAAFSVGGSGSSSGVNTSSGTMILAANSSINASSVGVGSLTNSTNTSTSYNSGVLLLGGSTSITTGTITVGYTRNSGLLKFASGVTNGTLVIRGTNASQRADIYIGYNVSGGATSVTGTMDLTNGTVDAMVGSMTIGSLGATSIANGASGTFIMSSGTLDAISIMLAQRLSSSLGCTGEFDLNGGTVKVQTLTLVNNSSPSTGGGTITANFNLNGGTLAAQTIQAGASGTSGNNVRNFNWTSGTIANYDANTDLTITGLTLTATTAGVHTFRADAGRTITIDSTSNVTGNGGITKSGAGKLAISGTIRTTGVTHITAGTMELDNAAALTLATGGVSLDAGGTGKLTSSVANATLGGNLTLASGTISPGDDNGVGTLTLAAGKNFSMTGGVLNIDLGGVYDAIAGSDSGIFSISGGEISLDVTGAGFSYEDTYTLLSGFSTGSVTNLTITGYDTKDYNATLSDTGILSFTAVPEPQTYGMLVGGIGMLLFLRRGFRGKTPGRAI